MGITEIKAWLVSCATREAVVAVELLGGNATPRWHSTSPGMSRFSLDSGGPISALSASRAKTVMIVWGSVPLGFRCGP